MSLKICQIIKKCSLQWLLIKFWKSLALLGENVLFQVAWYIYKYDNVYMTYITSI